MSKTRSEHPTRALLIEVTARLISSHGVNGFTVDTLLQESGVSKGSLYHHFENFQDVLEVTLLRQLHEDLDRDIATLQFIASNPIVLKDARAILSNILQETSSSTRRTQRLRRMEVYSRYEHGSASFRQNLAEEQTRLARALADAIEAGQEHGHLNTSYDAYTLANVMMAYTFGKVLTEISSDPVPDDDWAKFIQAIFDATLFKDV